jgi:hypothetical protein
MDEKYVSLPEVLPQTWRTIDELFKEVFPMLEELIDNSPTNHCLPIH